MYFFISFLLFGSDIKQPSSKLPYQNNAILLKINLNDKSRVFKVPTVIYHIFVCKIIST